MAYPSNGPNGQARNETEFYLNVRDPSVDGETSTKVGSIKLSGYSEYFVELFAAFRANPESMKDFVNTLEIDIQSAKPSGGKSAFLSKVSTA